MKPKTHLNGSTESLPEAIQRIETRIQKLRDDLQKMKTPIKPTDGFKHFLKTNVMGRRN